MIKIIIGKSIACCIFVIAPVFLIYLFIAWVGCIESLGFNYLNIYNWSRIVKSIFGIFSGIWIFYAGVVIGLKYEHLLNGRW